MPQNFYVDMKYKLILSFLFLTSTNTLSHTHTCTYIYRLVQVYIHTYNANKNEHTHTLGTLICPLFAVYTFLNTCNVSQMLLKTISKHPWLQSWLLYDSHASITPLGHHGTVQQCPCVRLGIKHFHRSKIGGTIISTYHIQVATCCHYTWWNEQFGMKEVKNRRK